MPSYLSRRIGQRYDNMSLYGQAAKKRKHPRKGTILIHGKPLVYGAPLKWVFGYPCWNHPAFVVKPRLYENPDGTYTLPSNSA